MTEIAWVICGIAVATFMIRLGGAWLGQRMPQRGPWARALNALPGTLIISLVAVLLVNGEPVHWLAAIVSVVVALLSNNLPLTMASGIACVYLLRQVAGMG